MKVLIDAVHPADVWTLGAVEDRLLAAGEETLWLSRPQKDSVVELIEARGRPHIPASTAGTSMLGLARELLVRDWRAFRAVRSFKPDVILTRSPAGVHAGRATRTPVMYDTDDGHVAGFLYYVAGPFANLIASPTATEKSYGKQHRRYQGYKELFYLHPSRFTPDPDIRSELGLRADEVFHVLRLTAFTASHDVSEAGMSRAQIDQVIERMSTTGTVLISSEKELPEDLAHRRIGAAPERFHHVLAAAELVVGDSQTVCSEAGVIGTPSLRFNTWAGRHPYQVELEERWGLTRAFLLTDEAAFFVELDRLLADPVGAQAAQDDGRRRMLEWCGDPVDDLTAWTYELAGRSVPEIDG
jgi:predicted glycosyltransferase